MIVSCSKCDSKYSVDDSKVEGKRFGFSCPKCGENVEIDNRVKKKETEEQLNEELFEETTDAITGEDDVDEEISLPDETVADFSDDQGEVTENEPDEENILKEMDELGTIGTDLQDELDITGSDNAHELSLENEEIQLPGEPEEELDDTSSVDEMELPDLENLADMSETGETAEDAINISKQGILEEEKDLVIEESDKNFEEIDISSGLSDESEIISESEETDSNLLEDFSPIEEDIIEDTISDDSDDKDMIDMDEVKSSDIFSGNDDTEEEDEDITIDLDSLDIQLEEDEEETSPAIDMEVEEISDSSEPLMTESLEITDFEGDESDEIKDEISGIADEEESGEEDEDITLDLDALDLMLDEVEELKEGEVLGDDERLSLSDAGLTPDELVEKKDSASEEETSDEDIRISIDEVAPEVDIDKKGRKKEKFDDFDKDELPEIDLEGFEDQDSELETLEIEPLSEDDDSDNIHQRKDFREHEAELSSLDIDIRDTVPGGIINFSIDYSFNYSRLGAIFRLICLYPVILIPHFIVLILYSVLSILLSFFNYIIILFSGEHEEDFTAIQENTIRYFLSLGACAADVVEDPPKFTGKKDIDYAFQLDVTYPITRSRVLAFLRLTTAGILITALPHLILLFILSIGSVLIYLIGLISIIIRKKWPKMLFDFMIRYYRYWANVLSYITGVIDRYPSFKFE